MKIRLLQEHDFTQWLPLWHDYVAFYQADV